MRLFKCKHRRFDVVRTIWPYREGYGTRCYRCGMIVDTGLPRASALESKRELERGYHGRRKAHSKV